MNEYLKIMIIICPLIFTAGFIDSIAGGGGLISLPAYLFVGLPTHLAAGTNKFASSFGTAISAIKYIKSGKVLLRIALISAVGSIIGSAVGTKLALFLPDMTLRIVIMIAIPIAAIFLLTQKGLDKENLNPKKLSPKNETFFSFAIGLFIGCYDGLIGPGTGTFLIIAYTAVMGIDLLTSSGCAKVSNLASNITSVALYIISGKVMFTVAIPAAVFSMLGNYAGASFSVKGGSKNVRKVIFVVLCLLFIKLAIDIFPL